MKAKALALLFLQGLMWGSSYLYIKVVVEDVPPITLVAGRLMMGAMLLLVVLRMFGLSLPREWTTWGHILVMSLVANVVPWTLIAWGGQHIDSGMAAVLNAMTPFFTMIFVVVAFRTEKLSAVRFTGLVFGFLGVIVLSGADLTNLSAESTQGQLAVLLSSVCYGMGFSYARRFIRGQPMVIAASQISLAFLIMIGPTLVWGNLNSLSLTLPQVGAWMALGFLSSGVAAIVYFKLISEAGATMASYVSYLIPIVGVTLGWLVLGESVGQRSLAGIALVLTGLAITSARRTSQPVTEQSKAPAPEAQPPAMTVDTRHN